MAKYTDVYGFGFRCLDIKNTPGHGHHPMQDTAESKDKEGVSFPGVHFFVALGWAFSFLPWGALFSVSFALCSKPRGHYNLNCAFNFTLSLMSHC